MFALTCPGGNIKGRHTDLPQQYPLHRVGVPTAALRPVSAGVLPRPDYILPFQGIAPKGLYISAQGNTLSFLHIRPGLS
ncbi:MAG: hypothetical protein D3903_19820 [Candidatus Electrothrix sp. GM3_4]|nr:hypothetical protein [Candidatus Electrothrix sp. GM3_4]